MKQTHNVIDLFCGCGGLSEGFQMAGYNIVLGVDNNDLALKTFLYNHKGSEALNADLSAPETFETIEKIVKEKKVDVIIGGPPCQGFSLTGKREFNDDRNKLYLAMIEMVKRYQPKAFLIENVPGMATLYKGKVKEQIINTFEDMGYNVSVTDKPLLAADYGVPQFRKRMFFVGFRKDLNLEKFVFPKPILDEDSYIGTAAAISDLPSLEFDLGSPVAEYSSNPKSDYQALMRRGASKLYNHVGTNHTDEVKWVISQVPEGGNYKDLPSGVGKSRKFNEAWTRYHSQRPSKTIDTGHRNHFHYKWNRVPTVRENARLQSFPDRFEFLGTKTQQNRQVGNAVPPLLAQAIAEEIKKYLDLIKLSK